MRTPSYVLALIAVMYSATSFANTTPAGTAVPGPVSTAADGWNFNMPAPELAELCTKTLDRARADFRAIETDKTPATLASVFGASDEMQLGLQGIQHVWYVKSVHPDAEIRAAAEQCVKDYMDFAATINLSPAFYQRVAAIDSEGLSAPERLMLDNQLRAFRKAGVDRDEKTRGQVRALINEITALGTQFDKNIREDTRYLKATADQLKGLPEDFIVAREPDDDGLRTISTDYPDYMPVMQYAQDDAFRRELLFAFLNIATPDNTDVLKNLIEKRHELARLLGYQSWAEMAMDGMMIENPHNAQTFLSQVGDAVQKPAAKDLKILLARLRKIDPEAQSVEQWQTSYLSNLVRQEQYALDAKEIREYFHFERVQDGIFQLTEDLFGVEIVPWETQTWHEDVTAWELRDKGKPIGRFYLDLHPREDKYKHAAHWT
ncbi:MAG: M3 family metallopeptidase, partial [Halioglobus sp.]